MATLEQLTIQRENTTDPVEYDQLTGAIAIAQKERDLAAAKANAELAERYRQEQEQAKSEYRSVLDEIQKNYHAILALDANLFEAAVMMTEAMDKRTQLQSDVQLLENIAITSGASLGFTYRPPLPSLVGGPAVFKDPHQVIKSWLARVEDYMRRLGRTPTLAEVKEHGLQGSTEAEDLPTRY